MFNPYATSQVNRDAVDETALAAPKKPKAVLLMQILAVAFIVFMLGAFVRNASQAEFTLLQLAFTMVGTKGGYLFIASIAIPVALFVSLQRRMLVGRILGLCMIAGLTTPVWLQLAITRFDDAPTVVGVFGACLALLAPIVYWGYAFSFSKRARAYFAPLPG